MVDDVYAISVRRMAGDDKLTIKTSKRSDCSARRGDLCPPTPDLDSAGVANSFVAPAYGAGDENLSPFLHIRGTVSKVRPLPDY